MPDYLKVIGDCFPDSQAYVLGGNDPTVYANLIWITAAIDQTTLDASLCAQGAELANGIIDAIHVIVFNKESTSTNTWLSHEGDSGLPSNTSPALMPFGCRLVGITFSNANDLADADVEIYNSLNGEGATSTNVLTWEIRGARVARKTDLLTPLIFAAGDKVSVYLKDQGVHVNNVTVVLYVQVLDVNIETVSESFSGAIVRS